MQKKIKKILCAAGYFLLAGAFVYILFVNLACAFSTGIQSRADIWKVLALSLIYAVGFPAAVFLQHRRIAQLERCIEVLEKNMPM